MTGEPYSKERQLARHERRTFRKRATSREWATLRAEKFGACRTCPPPWKPNGGRVIAPTELHHVVSRARGGDDVAANLVPLCRDCHACVTAENAVTRAALAASLTDSERAYVVGKLGEDGLARLFGATR
jgi:5-methylcytosine-specific restriction endonuclease McrA